MYAQASEVNSYGYSGYSPNNYYVQKQTFTPNYGYLPAHDLHTSYNNQMWNQNQPSAYQNNSTRLPSNQQQMVENNSQLWNVTNQAFNKQQTSALSMLTQQAEILKNESKTTSTQEPKVKRKYKKRAPKGKNSVSQSKKTTDSQINRQLWNPYTSTSPILPQSSEIPASNNITPEPKVKRKYTKRASKDAKSISPPTKGEKRKSSSSDDTDIEAPQKVRILSQKPYHIQSIFRSVELLAQSSCASI